MNTKFKVGDRVRLKNPRTFSLGSETLTIIGFDKQFIKIIWGGKKDRQFPLYPDEIEYIVKVGEQLTFSFMKRG